MTRVKICGIREVEHALAAASAGADFIGLVFALSRRRITPEGAAEIVRSLKRMENPPAAAGVFVNLPAAEINATAAFCGLDYVQLSGDETWEFCKEIRLPVIKALHIKSGSSSEGVLQEIKTGYAILSRERLTILLDTGVEGFYGGTGRVFDRQLAKETAASYPLIIAGGLTPAGVGQVVREIKPWGVDVSSGVETGGRKDMGKIKDFIQAVKGL